MLRIAEARGEEMYYGEHRSDAVTMGHRTFEAATKNHLIIADTDRGAISVLDWSGNEVAEIPMPANALDVPRAEVRRLTAVPE